GRGGGVESRGRRDRHGQEATCLAGASRNDRAKGSAPRTPAATKNTAQGRRQKIRTPCGSSAEQSRRFRVVAAATGRPGHSRSPKARTAPPLARGEKALLPPAPPRVAPGALPPP